MKSCKGASKNLSDMARELDNIANVTTVGNLPQKMEEAETAKTEVEAKILERVIKTNFNLDAFSQYLTFLTEWSFTRNRRRMGTVRKKNERCPQLDRKNTNFLRISSK